MASKRFLMVPVDSSAARMPRPGATIASATLWSSASFIEASCVCLLSRILPPLRAIGKGLIDRPEPLRFLDPERLDSWQGLTLQPLQKRPARGRDIGEALDRACGAERSDGIAAARDRHKVPGRREFRRRFRDLDCASVEWLDFEGAERPIPDQRLGARQNRAHVLDTARSDIENHLIGAYRVHGHGT